MPAAPRPVRLGGAHPRISLAIPDSVVTVHVTSKLQALSGAAFMQYAARKTKSAGFLFFTWEVAGSWCSAGDDYKKANVLSV